MRAALSVLLLALSVVIGGPASAQVPNWPAQPPPRPLPARDVTFPPYEVRTMANGLRVVAVMHHEQPVVSIRLLVRAGAALDPRGKAGLANLAASLLDQGTTSRSAQAMNDAIDFMGAAMAASAGADLTSTSIVVMKDSFEAGMRMLSEMVRQPAFAPEEIERQRQQAIANLRVNFDDPEFLADAVFDRLVYGFHPYGMPQSGTPETLAGITRDDLEAFHDHYFVPNNAIMAVVGDVTAEEAFAEVEKVFGDWLRRDVPRAELAAPPEPARRVIVVNKPDAVQTEVRVGQIGIKRNNPDYRAVDLALRILGGEGANRLHQVLRTERGLTYGAKADMDTLLESGDFEASTNTRTAATTEVLRLIVDQFWRLQRERVGLRELADAKAYLTGSFPLTIETPDAIATQVLNVLFYGLPIEELQSFRDRVNAVTPDDIERVSRAYLRPERLSIVLVGNAAVFRSQLPSLGFTSVETIDASDIDLMAANLRRTPARRAAVGISAPTRAATVSAYQPATVQAPRRPQATPNAQNEAQVLLDQMIAAKGGLERLRSIKNIVATTEATSLQSRDERRSLKSTTYLQYPDRVRVEGERDVVQVFNGRDGWVKDPAGVHAVPAEALRDLESGFRRDTIAALLAARDGRVHVRLLPDSKDTQGKIRRALEFSGTALDPTVMYIDPETHLVVGQSYVAGGMGRAVIEEQFSDYRDVDGLQVAFQASVRAGGVPVLERRVTEVRVNAALEPSLFTRPTP